MAQSGRRISSEDETRIKRLAAAGVSYRQIVREARVSSSTVWKVLKAKYNHRKGQVRPECVCGQPSLGEDDRKVPMGWCLFCLCKFQRRMQIRRTRFRSWFRQLTHPRTREFVLRWADRMRKLNLDTSQGHNEGE